ncbi:MAG: hypothetical protein JKY70_02300 [Mucilaginibacter sp.]|nr:hypothetical protein [Mucilaginibacter sp.]
MTKLKELIETGSIDIERLANDIGISLEHLQSWITGTEEPKDIDEEEALWHALSLQTTLKNDLTNSSFGHLGLWIKDKVIIDPIQVAKVPVTPKYWGGDNFQLYQTNLNDKNQLQFIIDQGDASNEAIADILSDLSILYRMKGGSGINFETTGILSLANNE